jgi:hypothetical protein
MLMMMPRTLAAIGLAAALAGSAMPRQSSAVRDVLRSCAGFDEDDIRKLAEGEPVSKTLPARDRREIAVSGAIRMNIPAAFFVERLRDIESFKRSALVVQVGRFGGRPSLADLAALRLDPADIADLRGCRVGDCGVKLPAAAIERFRLNVDWSAPAAPGAAEDLARRMLLENTLAYLEGGDRALAAYDDKRGSVNPAHEISLLRAGLNCAGVPDHVRDALARFPRAAPPERNSFLYWSRESFGLKTLLSVTHVTIFPPAPEQPPIIISKGIYSSHYLDASLSATWLVDVDAGEEPAIDVVYINRSRVDAFGGAFGRLARSVACARQREGMRRELAALKGRLEAAWRVEH